MVDFLFKKDREKYEKKIFEIFKFLGLTKYTVRHREQYLYFDNDIKDYVNFDFKDLKPIFEFKIPEVVYDRTKKELNVSDQEMKLIILDFLEYMEVVKKNGYTEMLFKTTDTLWHNLILDTESYLKFCLYHIGFFVHHKPYLEKKEITEEYKMNLISNYEYVHKYYINDFRKMTLNELAKEFNLNGFSNQEIELKRKYLTYDRLEFERRKKREEANKKKNEDYNENRKQNIDNNSVNLSATSILLANSSYDSSCSSSSSSSSSSTSSSSCSSSSSGCGGGCGGG